MRFFFTCRPKPLKTCVCVCVFSFGNQMRLVYRFVCRWIHLLPSFTNVLSRVCSLFPFSFDLSNQLGRLGRSWNATAADSHANRPTFTFVNIWARVSWFLFLCLPVFQEELLIFEYTEMKEIQRKWTRVRSNRISPISRNSLKGNESIPFPFFDWYLFSGY